MNTVNSIKYFGITVDSRLNWSDQINNVTAKARKTLGMTKCTLNPCTQQVKETAYIMLVRPKPENWGLSLEYLHPAWCKQTVERPMQCCQICHKQP